jgi:ABC-type nitrate/sulfonate/bicarbonate transport system substrate-binding protein
MTQDKMVFEFDRRTMLKGVMASVACSATSSLGIRYAVAAEPLKIGSFFVAIDYAPYLIAKSKGMFEKIGGGTAANYTMFQSLPPINEALATDQIDAVFEAEPPALIGSAAGISVKIVGLSCSLVQEILVPVKRSQLLISRAPRSPSWPVRVRITVSSNF